MVIDRHNAYHRLFLEETEDQLRALEEDLLLFEGQGYSEAVIQRLFRNAHSIKGASATMGLTDMTATTHELETLFNAARLSACLLTQEDFDEAYRLLDLLRAQYNQLLSGKATTPTQAPTVQNESSTAPAEESLSSMTATLLPSIESLSGRIIHIAFGPGADFLGIKAFQILRELGALSSVTSCMPENPEEIEDDALFNGQLQITLESPLSGSAVQNALLPISDIQSIRIFNSEFEENNVTDALSPSVSEQLTPQIPTEVSTSTDQRHQDHTYLKLSSETVDLLIALATEISLDRSALALMAKDLILEQPKHATIKRLVERIEALEAPVRHIQNTVLSARMLPLSTLFRELPRTVRDLSQQLGKLIRLEMEGGHLTLDKQVLQALSDPLQHLVRNAIDHGIEPIEERLSSDKRPDGLLQIHASQSDNALILTLSDDGRGIDVRTIEKSALAKGLVTFDECAFYTKEDWFNLLFRAGFSTKEEASHISGRGVGLDVVRENLQAINGQIRILSEPQLGTSFVIRVPISLSLSKNLIIRHSQFQIAIPIDNIQEIVRLKAQEVAQLHWTAYSCTYLWNETPIPVFDPLSRTMPTAPENFEQDDLSFLRDNVYLVIIGTSDNLFGLLAPELIREEELLMVPMGRYAQVPGVLQANSHLLSAAILNDGSLCYSFDLTAYMAIQPTRESEPISS